MTNYLEFLAKTHAILEPRGYLEIGVRYGDSLRLAQCPAIGIDPNPILANRQRPNETIRRMTSDQFFTGSSESLVSAESWTQVAPTALTGADFKVDFAFIDGMHLIENALRDFINIERYSNPRTVVAFDDVLPYNQAIAARTQPPGDWTGDVWKMIPILDTFRPDLAYVLVNTQPTGLLFVGNLDPDSSTLDTNFDDIMAGMKAQETVPEYILDRRDAVDPGEALERLSWWRELDERTQR